MEQVLTLSSSPSEANVREELDRLLEFPPLRKSPQLVSFLRYVVEARLADQSDKIKGYTIAVDALGRDASFDPQRDPIVRVEAVRLRRLMAMYYDGPGAHDAIKITMPAGAYVPVFKWAEPIATVPSPPTVPAEMSQLPASKRFTYVGVALAVMAGVALLGQYGKAAFNHILGLAKPM